MSSADIALTAESAFTVAEARQPAVLSDLGVGHVATVVKLRCERHVARRLMEMGLLRGTPVMLKRIAPLGDPLELRLRGFSLSIRRAEAALIDVVRHAPGPAAS